MDKSKAYIIAKIKMLDNDAFSKWLGIELAEIREGYCRLSMVIRPEMTNGFGIAHGGITFSLADSALAFASNSYGRMAVSIETSISHLVKLKNGESIAAEAIEVSRSEKIAVYEVNIKNSDNILVAKFKGTVYISSKDWDLN